MIREDKGQEERYIIPHNVGSSALGLLPDRLFGVPMRNLVDAGIMALVVFFLVSLSPVTGMAGTCLKIVCVIAVIAINAIGIKGESVTQFISGYITFLQRRQVYSLAPILFDKDAGITGDKDALEKGGERKEAR